jgi:hypothetical protein
VITRKLIGFATGVMLTAGIVGGASLLAQTPGPAAPAAAAKTIVPLKVQVTLSQYDGEKKTSSLPFTLWVNANDQSSTSLNVGTQVPMPASGTPGVVQNYTYRGVGTNMTCSATTLEDGRFRVKLAIQDSAIAPSKEHDGIPSFQSLTTENYLLLRDGQSAQFVAATDKVTGQVTKVEVTATVLK